MLKPASAHLRPGREQTDSIINDYGRGPIEISRLGQSDTLARPQALVDSTQAGVPSGTTALTSTDLRSSGGLQQAPFYDRMIRACAVVQNREAWKPGTNGLYLRPRGARPPNEHSTRLPFWNPRVAGVRWQRAMFDTADCLSPTGAFYVAADVWTKKNGNDWGLG